MSRAIKWADLENLSIKERITDFAEETGSLVTKSKAMGLLLVVANLMVIECTDGAAAT